MSERSITSRTGGKTIFVTYAKEVKAGKKLLVKMWHAKKDVKAFLFSYLYAATDFATIILGGLWNAYLLGGVATDSIAVGHVATGGSADLTRFAARFASVLSAPARGSATHIDLALLVEGGASLGEYVTIARFFSRRINLRACMNVETYRKIIPTIASASAAKELWKLGDEARLVAAVPLAAASIGSFRAPALYGNLAREFLKVIDGRKKFCLICVEEQSSSDAIEALVQSRWSAHRDWHFVVMQRGGLLTKIPGSTTKDLIWPNCAGLDFGTRLALAAEADATIGPSCIFTLAAALSGRPVTLLDSGCDLVDVAPDIRNVRTVPALDAADLDGEIKSLIERSDAEELKLTETTQEAMVPC